MQASIPREHRKSGWTKERQSAGYETIPKVGSSERGTSR